MFFPSVPRSAKRLLASYLSQTEVYDYPASLKVTCDQHVQPTTGSFYTGITARNQFLPKFFITGLLTIPYTGQKLLPNWTQTDPCGLVLFVIICRTLDVSKSIFSRNTLEISISMCIQNCHWTLNVESIQNHQDFARFLYVIHKESSLPKEVG